MSHGTFDLIPILLCRVPVLQYWHGCPIKKIGADVYNHSSKKIGEKIWEWIYKLIPHLNNYYSDYFVDNSINMNYSKTFKSFVPSYIQLPYPRLVTLYSNLSNEIDNVDTTIDELIFQKSKGKYIIVYMPTYREGINEQRDCENQLIRLSKLFSNDDRFVFVYKAHFIVSDTTDIKNENFLKYDNPDPYPLLSISSALISDYSSVIFDYMPTKKPLSIFAYDIDDDLTNIAKEKYGVIPITADNIYNQDVDIYAPCALGSTINDETVFFMVICSSCFHFYGIISISQFCKGKTSHCIQFINRIKIC